MKATPFVTWYHHPETRSERQREGRRTAQLGLSPPGDFPQVDDMERLTAILASVPSRTTTQKSGDSAQESRLGTGEKVLPPVAAHCSSSSFFLSLQVLEGP